MKKTLIALLVSAFVFSTALACVSNERQTKKKNSISEGIPTWQSYEIAEKQINMMLCSVYVDSISDIPAYKTEIKSLSSKNKISILSTYSVTTISLINGDVVENNEVDFADADAVRAAYGSFPDDENWNERADLDGSGEVDFTDINIARVNYGEIGD